MTLKNDWKSDYSKWMNFLLWLIVFLNFLNYPEYDRTIFQILKVNKKNVVWTFKKILLEQENAWNIITRNNFKKTYRTVVVRQNREKLSRFTVARLRHPVLPVSRSNLFEIAAQTRGVTCVRAKPGSLKFTTLNFKVATSVVLIIVARIPSGIFVTDNILLWKDYVWKLFRVASVI